MAKIRASLDQIPDKRQEHIDSPVEQPTIQGSRRSSNLPDMRSKLNDTYSGVADRDPDQTAEILSLAPKLGATPAAVERDLKSARRAVNAPTDAFFKRLESDFPRTSRFLSTPENMAIVQDDIENTKKVEETVDDMSFAKSMYNSMHKGLNLAYSDIGSYAAIPVATANLPFNLILKAIGQGDKQFQVPEYLLKNPITEHYDAQASLYHSPDAEKSISDEWQKGNRKGAVRTLAAQMVQNAPTQIALLLSRSMGYGTAGLVAMGGMAATDALQASGEANDDPAMASLNALTAMSAEAIFESLGTFGVAKHWGTRLGKIFGQATKKKIFKELSKSLAYSFASEFNEEWWTQIMQDWSAQATGINPMAAFGTFRRALDAGIVGGFSGTTMTAPFSIITASSKVSGDKGGTDPYTTLHKAISATKLAERSPEKVQEFVSEIVEGTEYQEVHIDAEVFDTFFQKNEIDPDVQAEKLGITESLAEARQTGGKVKINYSQWVAFNNKFEKETGLKSYQAFSKDSKFELDGLTENEKAMVASKTRKDMEFVISQQADEVSKDVTQKVDYEFVLEDYKKSVTEFLKQNKDFTDGDKSIKKNVDNFAKLHQYAVVSQAKAQGISIRDMHAKLKPTFLKGDSEATLSEDDITAKQAKLVRSAKLDKSKFGQFLMSDPANGEALRQTVKEGVAENLTDSQIQERIQKLIDEDVVNINSFYQTKHPVAQTYSKLIKTVEDKMSNSMAAEELLNTIEGSEGRQTQGLLSTLKADELRWMGIPEYLKENPIVEKSDFLKYLKEKQPKIEVAFHYPTTKEDTIAEERAADVDAQLVEEVYREGTRIFEYLNANDRNQPVDAAISSDVVRFLNRFNVGIDADYFFEQIKYNMGGIAGEYNIEWIFTDKSFKDGDPDALDVDDFEAHAISEGIWDFQAVENLLTAGEMARAQEDTSDPANMETQYDKYIPKTIKNKFNNYREITFKIAGPKLYASPHWRGENNVLAHARIGDIEKGGKKYMLVIENQSDWQSDLYKSEPIDKKLAAFMAGYADLINELKTIEPVYTRGNYLDKPKVLQDRVTKKANKRLSKDPIFAEMIEKYADQMARKDMSPLDMFYNLRITIHDKQKANAVPEAPILDNWQEFTTKQLINLAVNEGYDGILNTRSEDHLSLWGTDGYIWNKKDNGTWALSSNTQRGGNANDIDLEAEAERLAQGGKFKHADSVVIEDFENLREYLSSIDSEASPEALWKKMQAKDEGFAFPRKQFFELLYDKVLPKLLNKFAKPFGSTETSVKIGAAEFKGIEISDKASKGVRKEGLPLFQKSSAKSDKLFKAAKKAFKSTNDISKAAFILPDGTLLVKESYHLKMAQEILKCAKIKPEGGWDALETFLNTGAIRIDSESGAIHAHKIPTSSQYDQLAMLAHKSTAPDLTVDVFNGKKYQGNVFNIGDSTEIENFINNAFGRLYQDDGEVKGSVTFKSGKAFVSLFKSSDASTFIHESAHIWLRTMHEFILSGKSTTKYREDWAVIASWLNMRDGQKTITTHQHEKFARGFESYIRDGVEPSKGLRKAFYMLSKWMVRIYKEATQLQGTPLSEEVHGVMGRMLASEEAVTSLEDSLNYSNLADIAKLPTRVRKDVQDAEELAHEQAFSILLTKQMEELSAERIAFVQKERISLTEASTERISSYDIYRAIAAVEKRLSGNIAEITNAFYSKTLDHSKVMTIEGVAFENGYDSADEFFFKVVNSPSRTEAIAAEVADDMLKYDSMLTSGAIKEAASEAIHNEKRMELLALEYSIFRKLIDLKSEKDFTQAIKDSVTAVRFEAMKTKEQAYDLLEDKLVREATAFRPYITAERHAAIEVSEALAKKDYKTAAEAKRKQLLNHALALAAFNLRTEMGKKNNWLFKQGSKTQRLPKSGKLAITAEANENINSLLSRYGFASSLVDSAATPLNEYVAKLTESGDDVFIADWILNNESVDSNELTVNQMRDLVDTIKSLKHSGKREGLLSTGEKVEDVTKSIVDRIHSNLKTNPEKYDPNNANRSLDFVKGYINSHKSLSYIMRAIDGYEGGDTVKFVMGRLRKARQSNNVRMEGIYKQIEKIWDMHYPSEGKVPYIKWQKRRNLSESRIFFPESSTISDVFPKGVTREILMMIAMNQGTELNRQRVLESYGTQVNDAEGKRVWQYRISQVDVDQMLDKLDKNDWGFVQENLDLINSLWGDIAMLQRNRTGLEPRKQEAVKINTRHGEYGGGYFHIEYDPRWSVPAAEYSEIDGLRGLVQGSHIIPSTRRGHTKARVKHVWGRPLKLNFNTIDRHLAQVAHDLSFSEVIRDMDRIFTNQDVSAAIKNTLGDPAFKQIRPALAAIGFENRPVSSAIEVGAGWIRSRTAAFYLMYRSTSILSQTAGMGPAMGSVGPINYWATQFEMLKDIKQYKFVLDNSLIMKNRLGNRDREVRDAMQSFRKQGKLDGVKKYGFYLQGYLDIAVAMPQWMASYNKELFRQAEAGEKTSVEEAIIIADDLVQSTQGSGDPIDLSALQRGSELQKLLTMFYTPFSPLANKQMELWAKLEQNGLRDLPEVLSYLTFWVIFPAMAASILGGRSPLRDEDEEWLGWFIQESMQELFGGWIGVRDLASALFSSRGRGYQPTAIIGTISKSLRLGNITYKAILEGDTDKLTEKAGASAFEIATLIAGLPGRQMQITLGHIANLISGEEDFDASRIIYPRIR